VGTRATRWAYVVALERVRPRRSEVMSEEGPLEACGVHKSGSCREAVFVDQSAQAISTDGVPGSGRAGEP
jgi:hypothetical protein